MNPAAQHLVAVVGALVWIALAVLLAIAVGRTIKQADKREHGDCCPHPADEAPETVRGQFRAIVIVPKQRPVPEERPVERLDTFL